ncbi:Uncharacterised protein [Burkholderia pseudomallei]|nr:Uncharacterised protein [Burkholderia pseudomallei]
MPCRRSRSRSRQARDADSRATSRAAAIARDDNARRAPRHDAPRRTTAQTDALRPTPSRLPAFPPSRLPAFPPSRLPAFPPSRLPAFPPSSLPAFQPSSLPAFQDDRRAPPLFFRHAPSRSASRMSPRLGAIAHDPPVARDSIRAADAGRAASPEPRSRAAPRKTGQRNAPPVAPPTCRHADMPHCRHCRHCRRPAKPLVLTRQATQPHTHSATGVPSALHRRSVDERADNERSTPNARDRDAPRGAPRMRARSPPPHRASRHPGLLLNAFNPWITPSSARPCSSEPSHASTIASRSKSLYGADSRAACRASTP